jgi:hypothetical protein
MTTWAGAIVRVENQARFAEVAARRRITVTAATDASWVLIDADPQLGRLGPPGFAQDLSRDLQTTVVAFFVQSVVSNEHVQHWENGTLARELEFAGENGGWLAQAGKPQAWEPAYFFAQDEGTAEGAAWPLNLREDISKEELGRYERAKASGDATLVMDLLEGGSGGSAWGVERICRFFGVDPASPGARYRAPTNWKLRLIAIAAILFIVGFGVLGALHKR